MKNIVSECSVSSVLNKDVKMYGKKYLFDESEEICWSSDQGSPQWIKVIFKDDFPLTSVNIQFQGGFVEKDCHFDIETADGEENSVSFYPEDVNSTQTFPVYHVLAKKVKIVFENSTDFFGRIVDYSLQFR